MGTKITVDASVGFLKPDHTAGTQAAGSLSCDQDQLVIFVGSNVEDEVRFVEIHNAVRACLWKLKELSNPTPSSSQYAFAKVTSDDLRRSAVTSDADSATIAADEDTIGVFYGDLFQPLAGSSVEKIAVRALEVYQEQYGKQGG